MLCETLYGVWTLVWNLGGCIICEVLNGAGAVLWYVKFVFYLSYFMVCGLMMVSWAFV